MKTLNETRVDEVNKSKSESISNNEDNINQNINETINSSNIQDISSIISNNNTVNMLTYKATNVYDETLVNNNTVNKTMMNMISQTENKNTIINNIKTNMSSYAAQIQTNDLTISGCVEIDGSKIEQSNDAISKITNKYSTKISEISKMTNAAIMQAIDEFNNKANYATELKNNYTMDQNEEASISSEYLAKNDLKSDINFGKITDAIKMLQTSKSTTEQKGSSESGAISNNTTDVDAKAEKEGFIPASRYHKSITGTKEGFVSTYQLTGTKEGFIPVYRKNGRYHKLDTGTKEGFIFAAIGGFIGGLFAGKKKTTNETINKTTSNITNISDSTSIVNNTMNQNINQTLKNNTENIMKSTSASYSTQDISDRAYDISKSYISKVMNTNSTTISEVKKVYKNINKSLNKVLTNILVSSEVKQEQLNKMVIGGDNSACTTKIKNSTISQKNTSETLISNEIVIDITMETCQDLNAQVTATNTLGFTTDTNTQGTIDLSTIQKGKTTGNGGMHSDNNNDAKGKTEGIDSDQDVGQTNENTQKQDSNAKSNSDLTTDTGLTTGASSKSSSSSFTTIIIIIVIILIIIGGGIGFYIYYSSKKANDQLTAELNAISGE